MAAENSDLKLFVQDNGTNGQIGVIARSKAEARPLMKDYYNFEADSPIWRI